MRGGFRRSLRRTSTAGTSYVALEAVVQRDLVRNYRSTGEAELAAQAAFALRGVVERMQALPDELETMLGEELYV